MDADLPDILGGEDPLNEGVRFHWRQYSGHTTPLILDEVAPITDAHWTYLAERADWHGYRYRCCE